MIWVAEFARVERLHAGLRADGHEDRRIHDAMCGGEPAQPRLGLRIRFKQFKHRAEVLTQSRKAAKPQRKKFQHSSKPLHSGVTTTLPDFVHANQITGLRSIIT
jgi:hypothetical protein